MMKVLLMVAVVCVSAAGTATGQGKAKKAKAPRPDYSKVIEVAKLSTVNVEVQGYVSSCVLLADWKEDGGRVSCTVRYVLGPKDNIKVMFIDKDGVSIDGIDFPTEKLVAGEKCLVLFALKRKAPGTVQTIRIIRSLEGR